MNKKTLRSTLTGATQGNELEAILDDGSGKLYSLTDKHFRLIAKLSHTKITNNTFHKSRLNGKTHLVGTKYSLGEQSLDAARCLPEMNLKPVGLTNSHQGLKELSRRQLQSLQILNQAVRQLSNNNHAGTISLSMHPLAKRDQKTYRQVVTPKIVYQLLWDWGWDHTSGIITAHTSPWTSIDINRAADAISVIMGASPAIIAIFGNSPIVEGKLTGLKENRQTMWARMVKNSHRRGDRRIFSMPDKRPRTLAEYFNWMFGRGTQMTFVIDSSDYKTSRIMVVPQYPSMLAFLNQKGWIAYQFPNKAKKEVIKPTVTHLIASQWAHFADARWRFNLRNPQAISNQEFLAAVRQTNQKKVEQLFAPLLSLSCIESRPMGTALPCKDEPYPNPAITPNALQLGLLRNLDAATRWIDSFNWHDLKILRSKAVKHGLEAQFKNIKVRDMAQNMLSIALNGLKPNERQYLKRAVDIVESGQSAADRAIATYNQAKSQGKSDYQATMAVLQTRQFPKIS